MITTISATRWGNQVELKYAHKEPTALDLRRMAELLRSEALDCDREAALLEDRNEEMRRAEDKHLL